jgi:signal transduction histidine kinase
VLTETPEKKFEYGNSIMRNAGRLQKMISDIRDMSKIDNNALTFNKDQFDINKVILSTAKDTRENVISDKNKVNIVYNNAGIKDKDLIIEADKERIIQVLSNILDNALKFTKEGTISIDIEKNGGNDNGKDNTDSINNKSEEIIINIKDTGEGALFPNSLSFNHTYPVSLDFPKKVIQ